MAHDHPYQRAVIVTKGRDQHGRMIHRHIAYKELDHSCDLVAQSLIKMGLKPGDRTALMVPPSFEFFIVAFALFRAGIIPVLIDPGLGIKQLKKSLENADIQHFIGSPKAHLARILLRWNRGRWKKKIIVGGPGCQFKSLLSSVPIHHDLPDTRQDDTAAILFTSGSTGSPKGAIYSHRNFQEQILRIKEAFEITPGEIDLCTFPLFALFAPALGMTSVIPEMNFTKPGQVDPEPIFKAIETFGVQNMFGSPALMKRIAGATQESRQQLPTIKRLVSAGAPVPSETLKQLKSVIPEAARIYTPYGATESLPVAIADDRLLLGSTSEFTAKGHGVCVGRPVPGLCLKIIQTTDAPIDEWSDELECPQGSIGEITVLGPQVTQGYHFNEHADQLSKIKDPHSGRLFHRMGDLGYLDQNGLLWFCGRKAHRVSLSPKKDLYTVPGEAIINTFDQVNRSAIVGVGSGPYKQAVLCVETSSYLDLKQKQELKVKLLKFCQQFPQTKDLKEVLFHKHFPVDIRHNSKIFREKLAVWATAQL